MSRAALLFQCPRFVFKFVWVGSVLPYPWVPEEPPSCLVLCLPDLSVFFLRLDILKLKLSDVVVEKGAKDEAKILSNLLAGKSTASHN